MRRSGNREINIFNIAFLDVITGALGAFVLLTLLLAASMKKNVGGADPKELERLRALSAQLTAANRQLNASNQALASANTTLQGQNQTLEGQKQTLLRDVNRLEGQKPLVVVTHWRCPGGRVRAYLYAAGVSDRGTEMALFDPAQSKQDQFWDGSAHFEPTASDLSANKIQTDTWIYRLATDNSEFKLFYALQAPFSSAKCAAMSTLTTTQVDGALPSVELTAASPWAYPARLKVNANGTVSIEAGGANALTPAERTNIDNWLAKTADQRK